MFSRMTRGFNAMKALGRGTAGFGRGAGRLMGRYPYLTGFTGGVAATGAAIGFGGGRRQRARGRGFGATPPGYQTPDDYQGGAWWANR